MKKYVLLLVCFCQIAWGQVRPFHEIELWLDAERNDSALLAIQPYLSKSPDSYEYTRALLYQGIALLQRGHTIEAISRFHDVQNAGRADQYPDLLARTKLKLALMHESTKAGEHTKRYLQQAEKHITSFHLDSLRPEFYIRKASYLRVFEDKELMRPYLDQVFELAPKYEKHKELAEAHLLSESLYSLDDAPKKMYHLNQGIASYARAGNLPGQTAMYFLKGRLFHRMGLGPQAMATVDSSIQIAMLIPEGERWEYLAHPYGLKAELLERAGKNAESLLYLKQSFDYHKKVIDRRSASEVAELEAFHQLELQEYAFNTKNRIKNGILWIGGVGLLITLTLLAVIIKNARRLKAANTHLEEQGETIRRQASQLEKLISTKSQFYANISHELRTPLTLMLSPLDTLIKEGRWSDRQLRLLQIVQQGGRNLEFLVQQILDLEKLDSGRVTLKWEEVVVKSYFENLLAQFSSLAESKSILYSWKVNISEDEVWYLDREKIRQIAYNLLGNAFKFTPAGGHVNVAVEHTTEVLHFFVQDTGVGISSKDNEQIFERYYQENSKEGGLGLGLGICRELAALMGGKVELLSNHGAGSCFQVSLPIEPVVQFKVQAEPQHRSAHVLVVEDNKQVRDYLRFILQEHFHISTAENGERALDQLQSAANIDLVITDLMMPAMDGMDLVSTLKSKPKTQGIPVIMITAKETEGSRIAALRIGVDDYIQKPFREEELIVRIQNLLNNYAQRKGQGPEIRPSADQRWLEEFEAYIAKHYSNPELSIPEVGESFSMSESKLLRTLKKLTGLSPHQYLQEVRLKKAYKFLKGKKFYGIQEVALQCGYKDTKTFSRAFKNRFGVLPSTLE
jgi:signal transduction histidine kinase/DNA-binding response OmpR family regulator